MSRLLLLGTGGPNGGGGAEPVPPPDLVTPPVTTDLVLHLDALADYEEGLLVEDQDVERLLDRSGNLNHWTWNTTRGKFRDGFTVAGVAGHPAFEFHTTGSVQFTSDNYFLDGATEGEVFYVVRVAADPAASLARSGFHDYTAANFGTNHPYTDGAIYESWGRAARVTVGNPAHDLTTMYVYNVFSAPNDWAAMLNGAVLKSEVANTVAFRQSAGGSKYQLGRSQTAATTPLLHGWIVAKYVYRRKLTTEERAAMLAFLQARFRNEHKVTGLPTLVGKALCRASDDSISLGCENDGAMYRSTDDGRTWALAQNLGVGKRVTRILALASGSLLLHTRDDANGQWRSTNNGVSWVQETGVVGTYAREKGLVQLASGRLVAGCHNGHVFTSDDEGATWTDRGLVGASALVAYSVGVAANGNVVCGTNEAAGGQMYYSTDQGVTWTLAPTQPATKMGSIMAIARAANGALLATGGTTNTVWRSTDHGVTWTEAAAGVATGGLNLVVFRVPSTGTLLTMGTLEGGLGGGVGPHVRRSTDHGVTWDRAQSLTADIHYRALIGGTPENGRDFVETADGAILATCQGDYPVRRCKTDGAIWLAPLVK